MDNDALYTDMARARKVIDRYIPMIRELNRRNIGYCVVGGLAVLLHAMEANIDRYRLTQDADIMVDSDYSNADFARDYLLAYASDPSISDIVYDAVFNQGDIEELNSLENRTENISLIGASYELDGIDTPSFDVARKLNGRDLSALSTTVIEHDGTLITVADIDTLKAMKQETIELLKMPISETPRPQDYYDIKTLELVEEAHEAQRHGAQ